MIFTDATTINQNTLNLLTSRKQDKRILIINTIKKFDKVKCIKHLDENKFVDELKIHIYSFLSPHSRLHFYLNFPQADACGYIP